MAYWQDIGLPDPQTQGYTYQADAGIKRSDLGRGYAEQEQKYLTYPITFQAAFTVSIAELQFITVAILDFGYGWFQMSLPTGGNKNMMQDVFVRFTSDVQVTAVNGERFTVTGTLEQKT